MDSHERVKRPDPERTQPIRNVGTMFGSQGEPRSPDEPVSRGVEMGYRVIEEYLRQGQSVAKTLWAPPAGGKGGTPSDDVLQQRMSALFRSFSDFAGLWLDMMSRVGTKGAVGPFPMSEMPEEQRSSSAPETAAPEVRTVGQVCLSLELHSTRGTEVLVDLRPCSPGQSLRVHDLRAPEPEVPRLTDVKLELSPDAERLRLRVRIPEGHPPGVYSGTILEEETGLPRGTLCVRLAAA